MPVHDASDLDQRPLKRVIPSMDVPFGGLNDVPLNFGSQTSKNEIFSPWATRNSNTTSALLGLCQSQRNFHTAYSHHEVASMGGPVTSTNKSSMADGGHIEFPMVMSLYWMKIFAPSFVQTCNTRQTTDNNCKSAFSL